MENILLEMTGISKTFGSIKALESVDLYLKSGEVLGLIGENGAGKSTLMRILSGMENPDRGKTFIDGQEEQIPDPSHAYMLGIGMIPQDLILVPDMTVIENIFLGREIINRFGALNVNLSLFFIPALP